MALTSVIFYALKKKFCEILSITNQVVSANVDLPQVDIARSVYANAFEFGPRDFDAGKIVPLFTSFCPISSNRT